jgi:L-alanine-DL-glutamate epimerase-like enolase superfamily enzyme
MRLALTTLGCPTWDIETVFARASDYGFDGVDLRGLQEHLDVTRRTEFTSEMGRTRTLLDESSLRISALSSSIEICNADSREENIRRAQRLLPIAHALDVEYVRVFGKGEAESRSRSEMASQGRTTMGQILSLEGATDIQWIVETHDNWTRSADCRLLLDRIDSPNVGVLWDVGHTARVGDEIPAETLETLGSSVECHTEEEADPEACAAEAERVVDELGFDALKFDLDVPSGHEMDPANRHLRNAEIEHKVDIVEQVTDRVGSRADVAFDCHWAFSAGSARRLARELERFDVWWLEDPIPPENHDVQHDVSHSTVTPIAAGENVYRTHGQRRLIEEQGVDIIAPDVPKVGGMRETRKIAALADMYYVPVAMHNVSSPVGTMASAHVGAAIPNALAVEYHSYELGWWEDLVVEDDLIDDGYMPVPERPGLGITLDFDAVEAHLATGQTMFDES